MDTKGRRGDRAVMCRNRWLPGLFALLFLARALVPVGYMVAPGPRGGLALTLCSGFAPPAAASHHEHHHGQADDAGQQEPRHDPCPFALAGGAPLAGEVSPARVALTEAQLSPRPSADFLFPARPFTGAHGARAPPFVS